jgi:dephospho-CoA kinase
VVHDGSAPPNPNQGHQPVASPHADAPKSVEQHQPVAPPRGDAPPPPPFIGLTGAIAAGKSEALSALARLGAATLSTDELAHELLDDPEMRTRLAERWGDEVVVNGRVDRDRIGEIVFGSPEELAWLESVLHPLVGLRVAEWRSELPPDTALAVVEVPLLFEAGLEGAFDATVCVIAADGTRARRAAERGTELLEGRSDRQLSQDEKAARATHVIRNDGSLEELEHRLELLLPALTGIRGTA